MLCVSDQLLHAKQRNKIHSSNFHAQFNAIGAFARFSFDVSYINSKRNSTTFSRSPKIALRAPKGPRVPSLRITAIDKYFPIELVCIPTHWANKELHSAFRPDVCSQTELADPTRSYPELQVSWHRLPIRLNLVHLILPLDGARKKRQSNAKNKINLIKKI